MTAQFPAESLRTLSHYTDKELFSLIATSDEAAFTEIFRRYDKRIYPFALKMIRSEMLAEEITQEIFIKLWHSREKLSEIDNPQAYIFTISANYTLDQIKKQLNQRKMLDKLRMVLNESNNETEETLSLRDSTALIQKAIERLPERQKQVYHMNRQLGLSYEEIAVQLKLSRLTVRNHLGEAIRSIRQFLLQHNQPNIVLMVLLFKLIEE